MSLFVYALIALAVLVVAAYFVYEHRTTLVLDAKAVETKAKSEFSKFEKQAETLVTGIEGFAESKLELVSLHNDAAQEHLKSASAAQIAADKATTLAASLKQASTSTKS